jgi:hypothetical protein
MLASYRRSGRKVLKMTTKGTATIAAIGLTLLASAAYGETDPFLKELETSKFALRQEIMTCAARQRRFDLEKDNFDPALLPAINNFADACRRTLLDRFAAIRDRGTARYKDPHKIAVLSKWFAETKGMIAELGKPLPQGDEIGDALWRNYDELLFELGW